MNLSFPYFADAAGFAWRIKGVNYKNDESKFRNFNLARPPFSKLYDDNK